jgi:5-methyltetrahydropteroyltriglutamate--homocysteine methyltransferase
VGRLLAPREQVLITSSCGMNHLPRDVANGKLEAMAQARDILRG